MLPFYQDAIVHTLINWYKEFRCPKKPRNTAATEATLTSTSSESKYKGKYPGITMPTSGTSTLVPPPGEDSTSYERHTKALQADFAKNKDARNSELIGDLMSRSFALRRRFILEPLGISDLLKKFPFLQEPGT